MAVKTKIAEFPTQLDRLVRIATFGDSTATPTVLPLRTDQESQYIPFISGTTRTASLSGAYLQLHYRTPCMYVAQGGIVGDTIQEMIDRSGKPYLLTRRSIQDVLNKKPDVILFRGVSNTLIQFGENTTDEEIMAVAVQRAGIAKALMQNGAHIIDSGLPGFDGDGSYTAPVLAAIRRAGVIINSYMKEQAEKYPRWHFANPEGVISEGCAFYPGMSYDGTHPSLLGGLKMGEIEFNIYKRLFSSGVSGDLIYDPHYDFYNNVGLIPANHTLTSTGSTKTIKQCDPSGVEAEWVVTNASNGITLNLDIEKVLAGCIAGDLLSVRAGGILLDSDGNTLQHLLYISIALRDAADDTKRILYTAGNNVMVDGEFEFDKQFALPVNASDLGAATSMTLTFQNVPVGTYTVKFFPFTIRKYTPINSFLT